MSITHPTRAPAALAPDDPRLRSWRAFLEAHARVSRRLDEELRAEHGLSLAEYDALLQLAEAPDHRLRMNQLADRVILSRSGITRLIDRLEVDGLVTRAHCKSDARGAEAVLTPTGSERLRGAARTHLRGIDEHFLSIVASADLNVLGRSLGAVARAACVGRERPVETASTDDETFEAMPGPPELAPAALTEPTER
jgi:DNA-binding MarR family transcriptional regulator